MEESTAAVGSGIMVTAGRSSCRRVTAATAASSSNRTPSGLLFNDETRNRLSGLHLRLIVDHWMLPASMEPSQLEAEASSSKRHLRIFEFEFFDCFD
jgi:hypothetical protein